MLNLLECTYIHVHGVPAISHHEFQRARVNKKGILWMSMFQSGQKNTFRDFSAEMFYIPLLVLKNLEWYGFSIS